MVIDISRKNKAAVLVALYNASHPLGLGFLQFDPHPMTIDEAESLLGAGRTYFDYLYGRVMKIDLKGNTVDTYLYDRDNGEGAGERAINSVPDN